MSTQVQPLTQIDSRNLSGMKPFRLSIIALAMMSIIYAMPAYSQEDKSVAEIQAEIDRLQQILEKKKQAEGGQEQATSKQESQATPAKKVREGEPSILDVIVVRAQKRNELEKVKEVPKSVSVVSGESLEQFSATNITEVLSRVGNVKFNYGNPKTGSLSMRGISTGLTSGGSDQIDPSVGVTVDGVGFAYNALSTGADFVDLEEIDVTRGPQGSDGGKNYSIGRIGVTTKRPSFTPSADASLTLGQRNTVKAEAAIGGPIIDNLLAWRGTFFRNQQDGAYNNQFALTTGRTSYVNADRTYGKVQLLLTPSADFSARLMVENQPKGGEYLNGLSYHQPTPTRYADGTLVNQANEAVGKLARDWFTREANFTYQDYINYPVFVDNNGSIITGTKGSALDLNWKFSGHTLSALSSFKDHYFSAANDGDGTPFDITNNTGYISKYRQMSQELRLSSNPGGFVDYKTGVYFLKVDNNSLQRTRYGEDGGAWYANATQYSTLNADSNGRALLKDSLDRLYKSTDTVVDNKSTAAYGQLDWHLTKELTLTTGARITREDRQTWVNTIAQDYGYGAALNPVSINDVTLGGFSTTSVGGLATGNSTAQLSLADSIAKQYFGVAVTSTPGAAYNSLTATQKSQVAAAKAIRLAQLGTLYNYAAAEPYKDNLLSGNVSLSYKLNPSLSPYVTWQRGAKAGISQIVGATVLGGTSILVKPEISNNFELGVKSSLLDKTLTVSGDVFQDNIHDFQQAVYFYDAVATAIANDGTLKYATGNGNVNKVRVRGLELDFVYSGFTGSSINFSSAYNDARYVDFKYAAQPAESANSAVVFRDVTGKTLPQAPKFTFNLGYDYHQQVFGNKVFHGSLSYTYTTKYNVDTNLSEYTWVKAHGYTDLSIGLARQDNLLDVNFIAKNLFNNKWEGTKTWNTWSPNTPRWVGVAFSSKF